MIFKKSKEIIGVDLGSSSIKIVQLKKNQGSYSLVNVGMIALPAEAIVDNTLMDTTTIVEKITSLLAAHNIKNKDAVCSVSGNSVIIRKINLPLMTQEELEDQIQWEAEQYIPFDVNDVNIDFQILSSESADSAKMTVLLVASKKDIIADYISVFNEAGLRLVVMDVDSFAVQNAFEINYEQVPGEVVALVDIGASVINLNVVRDGISLFTRDMQMGGELFNEEIQKKFGMSSEEAENIKVLNVSQNQQQLDLLMQRVSDVIATEVRRSIDFYNNDGADSKISKMYISGGCAKVRFIQTALEQKLCVPVEVLQPFKRITVSEKDFDHEYLNEISPFLAVAVGLAVRVVGDK